MGLRDCIQSIFCWLDKHDWEDTGIITSMMLPVGVQQCRRCGVGLHTRMHSQQTLTKKAMDDLWAQARAAEKTKKEKEEKTKAEKAKEPEPSNKYNQYVVDRINAVSGE